MRCCGHRARLVFHYGCERRKCGWMQSATARPQAILGAVSGLGGHLLRREGNWATVDFLFQCHCESFGSVCIDPRRGIVLGNPKRSVCGVYEVCFLYNHTKRPAYRPRSRERMIPSLQQRAGRVRGEQHHRAQKGKEKTH